MSKSDDKTMSVERGEDQPPSLFDPQKASENIPSQYPREEIEDKTTVVSDIKTTSKKSPPVASGMEVKECSVKLVDVAAGFKRKFDEIADRKKKNQDDNSENKSTGPPVKQRKLNEHCGGDCDDIGIDREDGVDVYEEFEEADEEEDDDANEVGKAHASSNDGASYSKKRKRSPGMGAMASMKRLIEMEDRAPLCHLGETESNMFPKSVELMNHTVPVIYDSRVHIWFKADDFAKALGYKNYKSSVEKYVNPAFVLPYPNVLDLSRARYGDAFRLYSVNNKTAFINEAGAVQLFLRWLVSGHSLQQRQQQQQTQQQLPVTSADGEKVVTESSSEIAPVVASISAEKKTPIVKPKLSADWIDYQLQPALVAFSNATIYGKTAKELRYEMTQ